MRVPGGQVGAAACLAVLVVLAGAATVRSGHAAPKPTLTLRVATSPAAPRACTRVTWGLEVANAGAGPARLRFRNGQRGEVTLSRAGRVVYRWSAGRGFTQALGERTIAARGRWRFALADVLRVRAGRYALVARVTGITDADAALVARRTLTVRPARSACPASTTGSPPPPPPTPPPPSSPAPPPPSTPGATPARPPAASLVGERDTVRLAVGAYCWMLEPPSESVAAPCIDMIPFDHPGIPRLEVRAGESLTLRLAFEPTSLAVLVASPGTTRSIDVDLNAENSLEVPGGVRAPGPELLVVVADGSAGALGSGQVTYLAWLSAASP